MKYMGSKRRIAKYISPIIQAHIDSGQYKTYIEPFVGGANMIEHIVCDEKQGSDTHKYLIALFNALQAGWEPPKEISETLYSLIKNHPDGYSDELVGYVGFQLFYGAMWFGTYRRDNQGKRNYSLEAYNNTMKQVPKILDVEFRWHSYTNWGPENCVVYCDPPYANTAKYKSTDDFDHAEFWQWCKKYAQPQYNNVILVSEYTAPEGIECIWSKEINSSLTKDTGSKKGVEKLFWVK
jgi:DNA adenine methylase